jgi:hypothetical protein
VNFCLPQASTLLNMSVNVADEATIQVIETTAEGISLYHVSGPLSAFLLSSLAFLHGLW